MNTFLVFNVNNSLAQSQHLKVLIFDFPILVNFSDSFPKTKIS